MVDIIVGGQFGSEGKGKVAYLKAMESKHKCVARIGGPNSGHTVNGNILRQLPCAALIDKGICIIGAGSYIDVEILYNEILKYNPKLYIDPRAVIIQRWESKNLRDKIASTLTGTGEGVLDRISRDGTKFITEDSRFTKYIKDPHFIHTLIEKGCIVEGTQGFGLSNIHSPYYPYVTSRDTTASGFISELGVSPRSVKNIYLTIRTYPIRVGGNSGPLKYEASWESLGLKPEITSVTKTIRRVGYFDSEIVKLAILYNKPTHIVLNHLDYIPQKSRESYIKYIEESINSKIQYVGLSPSILVRKA